MAKDNITYYNMRLNLDHEQHLRIHQTLKDLNMDIHKSANRFIIAAVDHYIQSFEEEEFTNAETERRKREYISKADLEQIKQEIRYEIKDDIIHLLGGALSGGIHTGIPAKRMETTEEETQNEAENDSILEELVNGWG